jgi:hypothetical protein
MPHVRTQIRQAVRAALIAGGTSAGARVFDARVRPLGADELPAILIEDGEEQSEAVTVGHPIEVLNRDYALRVNAMVSTANEDHAALLDDLVAQIEVIVARDCFNAGGAQFIYPTGFQPSVSDEGEYTLARGTIEFKARYITSQLNPTIIR